MIVRHFQIGTVVDGRRETGGVRVEVGRAVTQLPAGPVGADGGGVLVLDGHDWIRTVGCEVDVLVDVNMNLLSHLPST